MDQMNLFGQPEPIAQTVSIRRAMPGESIRQRFEAFDEANPHVYEALVRLSMGMHQRGRRFGLKMLFEVLRWSYMMTTTDSSSFKLNNVYTSHYARKLIAEHPELAQSIETRTLRAE